MALLQRMPSTALEEKLAQCRGLFQSTAEKAQSHRLANTTDRAEEKSDSQFDEAGPVICAICLESPQKPMKLPCSHEFCSICVNALRSPSLQQLCPLRRKPLPPGSDKRCEQAHRLYTRGAEVVVDVNFFDSMVRFFVNKLYTNKPIEAV